MRYEKSMPVPSCSRRREVLSIDDLKKRDLVLRHLKRNGNALALAEGASLFQDIGLIVDHILASETRLAVYRTGDKRLRLLEPKFDLGIVNAIEMEDYVSENGTRIHYVIAPDSLYYNEGNALYNYTKKTGGESMAVHKERVFYSHLKTLNWSFLYPKRGFKTTGTQEAGEIELVDAEYGNIVKLLSVGEDIYIFRERGLSVLEAGADTLEFKLRNTNVRYPSVIKQSFARCSDGVYFFTGEGLFRCENRMLFRVNDAAVGEIDLTAPVTGVQLDGNYYASVLKKSGERHVYAYEKALGCGRFIAIPHVSIAARQGLYLLRSNFKVDLLSGAAFPEQGKPQASFCYDLTRRTGGAFFLEDILIEGSGSFEAEARCGSRICRAKGQAGERVRFNGALRADRAQITVTALSTDFSLESVTLGSRREDVYGN